MIIDKIENLYKYRKMEINTDEIAEFIANFNDNNLPVGKYTIQGNALFALVQKYKTRSEEKCSPESHMKYIDFQYIVSGKEVILWDLSNELEILEDKTLKSDIIHYKKKPEKARFVLGKGMFGVFFPQDAHTPCIRCEGHEEVSKIVFKIKR